MGQHLGELGKRRERDDTFGWFGFTCRVHPQATELRLFDFIRQAESIEEADIAAAMQTLRGLFGSLIHPDDFDEFWRLAVDNGQTVDDLMHLMKAVTEGVTGRPTKRRSGSSTGRRSTGASLKDVSSRQAQRQLERRGRADLALHVVAAREARQAS